jgi:hypothetical protein
MKGMLVMCNEKCTGYRNDDDDDDDDDSQPDQTCMHKKCTKQVKIFTHYNSHIYTLISCLL